MTPGVMEATGLKTLAYEETLAYTKRSSKFSEVADTTVFLASRKIT